MAGQDPNNSKQNGIIDNTDIESTEQSGDGDDEVVVEDYIMLDSKLDELNSALDYLEQKNDDIHDRLKELLESNINIRQEIRSGNTETVENK